MPARRVLLAIAILLLSFALVSSISPRQRERERAAVPPVQAQPARAGSERRTVEGRLPADRTVRAREGDVVELQVTSRRPDVARIVALGLAGPTEPGLPAKLTFLADRPGRFAVDLRDAGDKAGTLEITAR